MSGDNKAIDAVQSLRGKCVVGAASTEDSLVLTFDGECSLSIFNPYAILPTSASTTSLIGRAVDTILNTPSEFRIGLGDGVNLTVDLRDGAYEGPEAMVLAVAGYPMVCWN